MLGKSLSTTLFALGLMFSATAVYASAINDTSLKVTVPNLQSRYEFSITGLALKPGASNLNYVIYNKGLPLQSPTWTEQELRPGYGAAFALDARFLFPEGRDVSLDWTHLNNTTSATTSAPNTQYFLGPDYEIGPPGIPIRHATGHAQFKYDVANLDAGQHVSLGQHVDLRLLGGISNAYLREQVNANYVGNVLVGAYQGPFSMQQEVTANFTGIGPHVGMEAKYISDYGIGFLGKASASLLIGSLYSKTNYVGSSQQLKDVYGQNENYQTIRDQTVTQVIPGFDAKIGLLYRYVFSKGQLVTLEGGYQAAVYINAISQYLPSSLVAGGPLESGSIFVATMSHTLSNYSVQGPFLTANLQF